mmetsp:Transcript_50326/g.151554  ORF Transcript_50326/g.151554 Transcript_50326/m.151554 type:complete len:171 (-) Transcript_50326:575-1087(-)
MVGEHEQKKGWGNVGVVIGGNGIGVGDSIGSNVGVGDGITDNIVFDDGIGEDDGVRALPFPTSSPKLAPVPVAAAFVVPSWGRRATPSPIPSAIAAIVTMARVTAHHRIPLQEVEEWHSHPQHRAPMAQVFPFDHGRTLESSTRLFLAIEGFRVAAVAVTPPASSVASVT